MKIEIQENNKEPSEIINEQELFKSIQSFSEKNSNISKSLISTKFSNKKKINESTIENVNRLIENIHSNIAENEKKLDILMNEVDYKIAKIKKQLI